MDRITNLNTNLASVLRENLYLPIFAIGNDDVMVNEPYTCWIGKLSSYFVGEFVEYDGRVFTDRTSEELFEIWEFDNWDKLKDLEQEEQDECIETFGKKWIESLPWKSAIFVRISIL